jgi:hypothetical protein
MVDTLGLLLDFMSALVLMCMIEREFLPKILWKNIVAIAIVIVGGIVISIYTGQMVVDIKELLFINTNEGYTAVIKIVIYMVALAICCELSVKEYLVSFVISQIIAGVVEGFVILLVPGIADMFIFKKIIAFIVIICCGVIAIRGFKFNINFSELPKKLLIEVAILLFMLMFLIVGIVAFVNGKGVQNLNQIITAVAVIICIGIFIISAEGIMLEVSRMSLENENGILQKYNEQQKSYYELVLKNEEDTRRFRHDVLNHIMCLENYLDNGDVEQCKKYLSTMTEELNRNRKQLFHTGNRIADVMLTNILANKKEDVKVSVTGNLKENLSIEDYDLVVVISNILKNAVEAVNSQADESSKYINLNFIVGKKYLRIEEHNSIDKSQIESAQKLETTKEDKKSHGIGTKNIKRVADKYDGVFKTEVKDNEFAIIVELSLKKVNV